MSTAESDAQMRSTENLPAPEAAREGEDVVAAAVVRAAAPHTSFSVAVKARLALVRHAKYSYSRHIRRDPYYSWIGGRARALCAGEDE
jgi:hypothetical protein